MIGRTQRWKELVARLASVLLVLGASGAIAYRPAQVLRVSTVDFSALYLEQPEMQAIPIVELVKQEARRVAYSVERGPAWEALVRRAGDATASSEERLPLYVSNDALPSPRGERLVAVDGSDGSRVYVRIAPVDARVAAAGGAPLSLTRPWLYPGIAAAVLALLAYVLLRWKRAANEVAYKRWIPLTADAFGFALVATVGALASPVLPSDPVSAILVVLGGLVVASPMLLMGAFFACQRLVVVDPGIRYVTLFGVTDIPYERIVQAGIRLETGNKALGLLLIALGVTNCVTAIAGLAILVRKHERVVIVRDDGRTFGLWVASTRGVDDVLVPALVARGKWLG
ncbi:MAG: hypothetical protein U0230_10900 [Polyangiales bacterium]